MLIYTISHSGWLYILHNINCLQNLHLAQIDQFLPCGKGEISFPSPSSGLCGWYFAGHCMFTFLCLHSEWYTWPKLAYTVVNAKNQWDSQGSWIVPMRFFSSKQFWKQNCSISRGMFIAWNLRSCSWTLWEAAWYIIINATWFKKQTKISNNLPPKKPNQNQNNLKQLFIQAIFSFIFN